MKMSSAVALTVRSGIHVTQRVKSKKGKQDIAVRKTYLTATGYHIPYGITVLSATRQR